MHAVFSGIEEKIGYRFKDGRLLEEAFTHVTYAHLHKVKDNERVEFLGDTVLQFVITDYLYKKYPTKTEGELTRLRAELVCEESLLKVVHKLQLEGYLRIEGGKANVGKKTYSSLFETVTGAIYLDGGYENAKKFIFESGLIESVEKPRAKDAKSRLQEYLQGRHLPLPTYLVVQVRGEAHDQEFTIHCQVSGLSEPVVGTGSSRRKAEQAAAEQALKKLELE